MKLLESLVTGHAELDAEHARLLEELQRIRAAGPAGVPDLVAYLRDHVRSHFVEEERIMDEAGYPDAARHKAEHGKFASAVVMLEAQIERSKEAPESLAAATALVEALVIDHVMRTDYRLAEFLRQGRGSEASPPPGGDPPPE